MFEKKAAPLIEQDIVFFLGAHGASIPEEHRDWFMGLMSYYGPERFIEAMERLLVGILEVDGFPVEAAQPVLWQVVNALIDWNPMGARQRAYEINTWLTSILDEIEGNEVDPPAVSEAHTLVAKTPPPGLPGGEPLHEEAAQQ